MSLVRIMLAILITISLAIGPAGSAFAASHASGAKAMGVSAGAGPDMADCHKSHQPTRESGRKPCSCCDTKSACAGTSACMSACCKVLGALVPVVRFGSPVSAYYTLTEPAKPPGRAVLPPLTPPRS